MIMNDKCPSCGVKFDAKMHAENGEWAFEPVSNLSDDLDGDGMFCFEWDENHLEVYYHSPKTVESV